MEKLRGKRGTPREKRRTTRGKTGNSTWEERNTKGKEKSTE